MKNWFNKPGAYVLVDGQFGSTGKGLLASYIASQHAHRITHITTNAGPNSGHTAYFKQRKIMTQQIPIASVVCELMGNAPVTLINAGAIIDSSILNMEILSWLLNADKEGRVHVHPNAALITSENRAADQATLRNIAGTGKGVGPALAEKIARVPWGKLAKDEYLPFLQERDWDAYWNWETDRVFVETAQGFSLGINTAKFYPHVTSRECTVAQAIADARIPAGRVVRSVACFRTYPIRVGDTQNSSGDWYEDQEETTWTALGLPRELTTVTKRQRRIATFSFTQFAHCVRVNEPTDIFLNFCNYLDDNKLHKLITQMMNTYSAIMGGPPQSFLLGFGPNIEDIKPDRAILG